MIKICLATLFLMLSVILYGQDFDSRLLVKYSAQELAELKENNPAQLEFLHACLEKAFYITDIPKGKGFINEDGTMSDMVKGEVVIEDLNQVNFFALNIELIEDRYQSFKIKGHDKLLVVRARAHIQ